jgi:hypothetical protein
MAKNLLNKYVWLAETIYKAKKISFEDINRRWLDNDMSEKVELSKRTFHKWRIEVEEMFGLIIENENKGQYRFYIQNADELKNGTLRSWLFNTLTVNNLLLDNMSIKNRILLEEIPEGQDYLPIILKALKKNQQLTMTYQSYWRNESNTFEVEPYCLKMFRQRWYLVARSPYYNKVMIYALDRIDSLEPNDVTFSYPDDFSPQEFFADCFGIIVDADCEPEDVRLKVSAGQANYLRSLHLHESQEEVERTPDYSIFQLHVRPVFDFQQALLAMGEDVEVLSPQWFRDEMAEKIKRMNNKYNTDK